MTNGGPSHSQDLVVDSDVIVVGAGPAGSTTARYLATRGLNVSLLDKAEFPRDKVCGDGLTPRCTRALIRMGIDVSTEAGWIHNQGLRVYGGRVEPFVFPWPELETFPTFGLARRRTEFDHLLADHAVAGGAHLYTGANVTEPVLRQGRIVGVRTKDGRLFNAPVVVAADGNSSRLALAMGREKRQDRPMGVAVRTYVASPRHDTDYMESWLQLWDGTPGKSNLLPGYGWAFPLGDGTMNVGLGTVAPNAAALGKTDYRAMLETWLKGAPDEWGISWDGVQEPIKGAALPMSFNRQPAYADGLLLVGDSGGMISPFNGEGIAYALEAGELAADAIAEAHYRGHGTSSAERALQGYQNRVKAELGGYFRLGNTFVKLINNPQIMNLCTTYGLPRPTLMRFVHKLLAHLYDTRDGDWMDKVITAATKVVPSA
ncbi:MAG TPA: geranylgeranyl reductase family protein [Propioniciclava tarda]|nr:geranylgeranyl reductase family protein [Propioniciclava tarda]